MLLDYTKKELEELGKIYGIKGIYKLKKTELIEILQTYIPANMANVLVMLTPEELEEFEALIAKDKYVKGKPDILQDYNLLDTALVELIETKKGLKLTVDLRIKEGYKKLDMITIKEQARANDSIRTHIMGLLNLYGAVEIRWVCELYTSYHHAQLDEKQVIDFMEKDRTLSDRSKVVDNYIVEEMIYSIDEKNFYEFIRLTKDKQYYIPAKNYIELVSDELYYDNTLQVQMLMSYLRKNFTSDETIIEEAVLAIIMIARVDCNEDGDTINIMLEEWAAIGIEIQDFKQENEAVKHILNVINTTRKWINKGYTQAELSVGSFSKREDKIRVLDVGKNALCSCGSGKKHKDCCGKAR
ncbi:YecA family protein [Cellulosilyticum sp. I15G10I2]|uniref:YecA family protein n=1 Tax=Cellulosilyticum sp. I15G10I2 TaxID=1892843 RepID=UPI00085CA9AF|nr:SEC-C domain-containing protein [Cellulosilyticum sp. I15G10I2]